MTGSGRHCPGWTPRERESVLEYLEGQPIGAHAESRRCLATAKEKLRDFYLSIHVVSL